LYLQSMLNASGSALLGPGDINPSKMNVQGTGTVLYQLMELKNIEQSDLNQSLQLLQ